MLPIRDIGELEILKNIISKFKTLDVHTFGCVQGSGMGTSKCYMLAHLVSDLKRLGDLSNLSVDIF